MRMANRRSSRPRHGTKKPPVDSCWPFSSCTTDCASYAGFVNTAEALKAAMTGHPAVIRWPNDLSRGGQHQEPPRPGGHRHRTGSGRDWGAHPRRPVAGSTSAFDTRAESGLAERRGSPRSSETLTAGMGLTESWWAPPPDRLTPTGRKGKRIRPSDGLQVVARSYTMLPSASYPRAVDMLRMDSIHLMQSLHGSPKTRGGERFAFLPKEVAPTRGCRGTGLILAIGTVAAYADNLVADGDGDNPVAVHDLGLGTMCEGDSRTGSVRLAITRQGQGNVFANNAHVTVSRDQEGANTSTTMVDASIILDGAWQSQSNNTVIVDTAISEVTVNSSGMAPGSYSQTVRYNAHDPKANSPNETVDRNGSLNVTFTVEECQSNPIPPTADFSSSPEPVDEGQLVSFTDASSDVDGTVTAWNWDFGDGGATTIQNPNHIFADNGTFSVCLTVTDSDGLTDQMCKEDLVAPSPANHRPTTLACRRIYEFRRHASRDTGQPRHRDPHARIVRGPSGFTRVHPGDIRVCPYTDPFWTSLLRVAAGVVTETGGGSHAAIRWSAFLSSR